MLKKEPISVKLPKWLIEWMDAQPKSRAVLIEEAICKRNKIKPPNVEVSGPEAALSPDGRARLPGSAAADNEAPMYQRRLLER